MPFLERVTLEAYLQRHELGLADSLALVRHVATALVAAHARGVVHRDIKPSNLLLLHGDPMRPVLLDFGVARLARAGALTATGALVGTVGYMAPEQASGDMDVDPAADVFALGCVLYECLSGRPAFGGATPVEALAALLLGEPAPLPETYEPQVERLVRHMIAKDPRDRPQSGAEVVAAIDVLARASLTSVAPSTRSRRAMTASERRVVSLVIAATAPADALGETALDGGGAVEPLRGEIAALGGQLVPTGSGYMVMMTSRGSAADQVARAAQCARLIAARVEGARTVVATGPTETTGTGGAGPVFERASALIAGAEPGRVLVDDPTAALLEGRFEVARRAGNASELLAERVRGDDGSALPALSGRDKEIALCEATLVEVVEERMVRAGHRRRGGHRQVAPVRRAARAPARLGAVALRAHRLLLVERRARGGAQPAARRGRPRRRAARRSRRRAPPGGGRCGAGAVALPGRARSGERASPPRGHRRGAR
jgi:hypothetical protein